MSSGKILVVDDEHAIRATLRMILEYEGYEVIEAANGPEALERAENSLPHLVLLDIKMPGMDGMEVLRELVRRYPNLPVIMLSGHGTIATAVEAVRIGAADFLEKPPERERILLTVKNTLDRSRLQQNLEGMLAELKQRYEMIGDSPALQKVRETIRRVAPLQVSVLITGESGTGKELVARQIHIASRRAAGPFVHVNCAAIPETLIENELFGHEKGAYTGAGGQSKGKFEQANHGTIFLDEIGDMSLATQAKVLRVLQDGEYQRVGGQEIRKTDARVLAATNKDLPTEIAENRFREDLYYRLNIVPIRVPPLRERTEDIPLLVEHFRRRFAEENGVTPAEFTPAALRRLRAYPWPGNIRQLKNFVERHLILCSEPRIDEDDLIFDEPPPRTPGESEELTPPLETAKTLQDFKEEAEKRFLLAKLEEHNWNVKATAQALKTPRSNLYKRMAYFGIDPAKHRK